MDDFDNVTARLRCTDMIRASSFSAASWHRRDARAAIDETGQPGRHTEFAVAPAHVIADNCVDRDTGGPIAPAEVFERLYEFTL